MSRTVVVNSTRAGFVQTVSVGPHLILADESIESGGMDAGPGPYELLLAALGACTGITIRLYAERKHWPLEGVKVRLTYSKVHEEDETSEPAAVMIERIKREISITGNLSEDQLQRLLEIANKCPVHRTLTSEIRIYTKIIGDN
jgi:uncharacterized OsmC-like protein